MEHVHHNELATVAVSDDMVLSDIASLSGEESGKRRRSSESTDGQMNKPTPIKNLKSAHPHNDAATLSSHIEDDNAKLEAGAAVVPQPAKNDRQGAEAGSASSLPRSDSGYAALDSDLPELSVTWAVASEQGYRNVGLAARQPIHAEMEDVHWPTEAELQGGTPATFERVHSITGRKVGVFVLTDGHGGSEAPQFFVPRMRDAVYEVMDGKDWDFSDEDHREAFDGLVGDVFEMLDREYCQLKVQQYRIWMEQFGSQPDKRPVDDGCTMVVNVLYAGWLVNCNVGDSRTVLAFRNPGAQDEFFTVCFGSNDHNMTHPEKIYDIHVSGGQFVNSTGTSRYAVHVEHPMTRHYRPYDELNGARLFRPANENTKRIGVSHKRTLNLTSTMGDLLFKVEPAVLRARPDVSFFRMDMTKEYMLVIATDGLWDHLHLQSHAAEQNDAVMHHITHSLDEWPMFEANDCPSDSDEYASDIDGDDTDMQAHMIRSLGEQHFRLWRIAKSLVRREGSRHNLFVQRQVRLDDCTVFAAHIVAQDS